MRPRLRNATKTEQPEECTGVKDTAAVFELQVLDEMRALGAKLDRLCAAFEDFRARVPGVAEMRAGDEALLRLIWKTTAGRRFAAFELVDHAGVVGAEELRAALVVAVGEDLRIRRIGKLLARLERLDTGGVVLRRVERDRLGTVWRAVLV